MQDYKVVAKRKYVHNQNNKLILVKEYSIIEKDNKRYLVLKLFNNTKQTLTRFDFTVVQKSLEGEYIATNEYKKNSVECPAMSSFIPELSLEISKDCEDVSVELKNAVFETFLYDNGKNYTISAIGGRKIETNDNVVSKKFVSKLPFISVVVFLLIAALILTATYYSVIAFKKDRTVFNIDDFKFSYTTDKRDDDSPIYVKKYTGQDKDIRIPTKIKEHKIEYIGDEAFKDNQSVENIKFESDMIIKKGAFQNCKNLRKLNFDKVRFIADEAFMSAGIEDFTTTKTMHIGENAFLGCEQLKTINIDNQEETVEIFNGAFSLCSGLKDLILHNKFTVGENVFKGCNSLETLEIEEYSYLSKQYENLKEIFCVNQDDSSLQNSLKDVHINHMDKIPDSFAKGIASLQTLKINVINELAVPDYAFKGCKQLRDLSLPIGIKKVGVSSFEDCGIENFNASNVESIASNAFKNCVNLENFNLTNKVTVLNEGTFSGCEKLTKINIPRKVTSLPNDIFSNCKSLTEIKISPESKIVSIGGNAFSGCSSLIIFEIPKTVTRLGDAIFESCTNLKTVAMPIAYDKIPTAMFKNCEQLVNIQEILTKDVTIINDDAFSGCKQLTTITLPENITIINKNVFSNCSNLQTVNFVNNKCTELREGAFSGCKALNSIDLPLNLTKIGPSAFSGCGFNEIYFDREIAIGDNAYASCANLKSFVIKNENANIGNEVLKDCKNLVIIHLPYINNKDASSNSTLHDLFNVNSRAEVPETLKSVTIAYQQYFAPDCFADFTGVEQFVLPNAIALNERAFANCTSLKSFDFINTITNIGSYCFMNCKQLKDINIQNTGVYLDMGVFVGCDGLTTLTIPDTNSITWLFDMQDIPQTLSTITVNTTYVSYSLFERCSKVKQINLPLVKEISYNAFEQCNSVEKINLAEGLTTIGDNAFANCYMLETLIIPSTVTNIGYNVFYRCNNLYEIVNKSYAYTNAEEYVISEVKTEQEQIAVMEQDNCKFALKDGKYYLVSYPTKENEAVVLPRLQNNNYIIKKSLFRNRQLQQDILIPNCVEEIDDYAFYDSALTNAEFEWNSHTKSIGQYAFSLNNIAKIEFGHELEEILEGAFMYCNNLQSVTLPSRTNFIGDNSFLGCTRLYELFNNSSLDIKPGSMDNGGIAKELIEVNSPAYFVTIKGCDFVCTNNECKLINFYQNVDGGSCLQNGILDLPNSVSCQGNTYQNYDIKEYTFYNNYDIREIRIPSMVKKIGEGTFSYLYNLTKVTIGDNSKLLYIGKSSFINDSNLLEINIPNGLKVIGDYAFSGNTQLKRIKIPNSIEKIGDYAFEQCTALKEVLNLSSLPITEGNDNYGMVAKNAIFVNKTETPYITYYNDDIYSVWAVKGKCEITNINFSMANCDELYLPETFELEGTKYDKYTIKDGVFNYSWLKINKLFIPKALQSFNKNTFKYEENGVLKADIKEIIFSEDSLINIIEEEAFSEMRELSSVTLPLNIREIGRRAFYNCTKLNTHIELDKLYKLNEEAFANCKSLETFALPKTIKVIQNNVFANCDKLIYVENKSDFKLQKGKDGCGQIALNAVYISGSYDKYPTITRFDVTGKTTFKILGINEVAFIESTEDNVGKRLEIPSKLVNGNINYNAIQILTNSLIKCSNCTEIYIPKEVTVIEQGALPANSKLQKVYYQGTKEEWEKVAVNDKIIGKYEPNHNSVIKNGVIVEQNKNENDSSKKGNLEKKSNRVANDSIEGNDYFYETKNRVLIDKLEKE